MVSGEQTSELERSLSEMALALEGVVTAAFSEPLVVELDRLQVDTPPWSSTTESDDGEAEPGFHSPASRTHRGP